MVTASPNSMDYNGMKLARQSVRSISNDAAFATLGH
ncbi:hypothetical protein [Rhodanobacter soli]